MVAVKRAAGCLHRLIEAQARRSPGATAVVFEGQRLSYRELDRRAGQLALRLRALGAGPEVRIALFLERSLEMVLGILGILKAGAAYVPIDPAYPDARVAFMLDDSGATIVLSQGALLARLPGGVQPLCIDGAMARALSARECADPGPDSLAYVIYTSGSTGRPKGVAIEHRNIVNYVLAVAERLRFEPGMQHAMLSTVAADLGNTVLFPALTTGGCLHVVSQDRAESQGRLGEYFSREGIDVLKIAPSHLAALQSGSHPERVLPRRRLILGGEPCPLERIRELHAMAPECEIHNHYGPTETTVGVLTCRVDGSLRPTPSATLPLGTPLSHTRVHVLEADGRPCSAGEKGELFIGGAGVARGYLNRPDLTAERFVADPFSAEPGARLYRSGDLGRLLPDGSIEFCGRTDSQLKLGGYRVEPAEIEQALLEHGSVRQAVVAAREDRRGEKQLVAYVVTPADAVVPPASLRKHLQDRLPRHMLPQAFVVMSSFPLLPNGKVDRLALPAVEPHSAAAFVEPRSETEKSLAALWCELLQAGDIGVHDDFFDLGGKSLVAMKMVARIRDAYGVDMQLRNLFERPTIAGLAELIEGLAWVGKPARPDAGAREEVTL